jgi:hypothetical protein
MKTIEVIVKGKKYYMYQSDLIAFNEFYETLGKGHSEKKKYHPSMALVNDIFAIHQGGTVIMRVVKLPEGWEVMKPLPEKWGEKTHCSLEELNQFAKLMSCDITYLYSAYNA